MIPISARTGLSIGLVAVLALGAFAWFNTNPGTGGSTTGLGGPSSNTIPPYDCPKPAANSELLCDILPAGYVIVARLPNAPTAYCLTNMSATACTMLKQTQTNGVCDPNETWRTSPLDCGCTGALVPDPFTGRCAAPASVCLAGLHPVAVAYALPGILKGL